MTDEAAPAPDDARKQRRVLYGLIAGIALIGIVGVSVALTVGSDSSTPSGQATTTPTLEPLSVQGLCGTAHVATYSVDAGKHSVTGLTATGAAKPWLLAAESSQTTNLNDSTTLAGLGRPGAPLREVLTVHKGKTGWTVVTTTACLDQLAAGQKCAVSTATVVGRRYREKSLPAGTTPGVAAYVGLGKLRPCIPDGATTYRSRGVVAPVTAYTANEEPAKYAVVIADQNGTHFFVPAA